MSQIYYKFKSAKDYDNITFDGLGISVFDAKKEILTAKKLKGNDFDIVVSHAESGEDYIEDTALIPRNTPIVVRRVPTKPGKGTAHRYLEGAPTVPRNVATGNRVNYGNVNGSLSKTFDSSKQQHQTQVSRPSPVPTTAQTFGEEQTEEDRIAAMFAQSSEFWEKTQEQMASKPALRRPNQPRPQVKQQIQKALPPNYVCYRCGQKGHWIQACPTNGDRSFDHMKVRKTTGIPRSFLQKVEQVPPGKGVLVTQDGNLVIAQANDAAWQKFHARQKSYVTTNEVLEDTFPVPQELQCMICSRLLREAVITPCCQASFCDECIRTALINPEQEDQQFKCPNCRSPLLPDDLLPDKATREAVDNHLRDWARRRNEQQIVPEGNSEDDAVDNNIINNNSNSNNNNNVVEESTMEMSVSADSIEKEQQSTDFVINEQPLPAVKVEDKDKEFDSVDTQIDIAEDGAQQTTATAQPPKAKTELSAKVELPKKPTHDLPQAPPQQQSASSQQAQTSQQSQQSSQFQPQQQLSRQQHQFPNANGKSFPQQNPATAQQQASYGQFGYYNDYGFGYDQGQYWYDDAGYPQMNMNMMNAPGGYYDPSYFESGFYPGEPFPAQPQFMPFRPPVYDDFWDNRPMMPPQGNFTPFGNNMGGSMGGAMQPFRGGGFRGGFLQRGGNFQNRGRGGGRGRGTGFFHEQRPFNSGRGNNGDFRRESSMGPSIGRREASEREYREGESKYDDERLVDDFGRDLARRKSSVSHHSLDKENDTREKLSPPIISDRDRRDRDVIPDEDLEIRRREKARSRSRSRSKERRSSSRSHHRSSRRHREGSNRSRSPSRHDRMLYDERRKSSTSSRRRSRSRDMREMERKDDRRYVNDRRYYDDDRRYSASERREERRESISDRRSDRDRDRRESLSDRRDDRRDSYNSSRYDSRRESISDRKDRRISMDEKKDEIRNQGLHNERYEMKVRTPSPNRTLDDENGKNLYHSPQHEFDIEMQDVKNNQAESIGQTYDDTERQSRSESPKLIIDTEEFQVPEDDDDNVIDVSTNDDLMEDDDIYQTKEEVPNTPPSPDKDHSSPSEKRRHSSSHKHRSNKYRSSHHRRESMEKEDERRNSLSKSRHNTYSKDDYHRNGSRKHKKHHSSRHHSNRHHSSRSKDGENNRRRHHSRDRDERR
ncbi:hypothetical protein RclHR1_05810003 [Rhizophagus clarus]|uniref:DWNN-domain-containing protein n=1 Tax=Rhizophagus clarus TaxID=94130 RepID=A0A2Z6RQW8_9GLOM|nr:hypothetical protein RclHR1_05810003 [Rhizophagus clarus]GES78087.1 DWNN-domain-containing protein [Rhizophagus clarus]